MPGPLLGAGMGNVNKWVHYSRIDATVQACVESERREERDGLDQESVARGWRFSCR